MLDWWSWSDFVYGLVMYFFGRYMGVRDERKKDDMPYKWECPVENCTTGLSSNDMAWLDRAATRHSELHNE
jgi:hypothetical protein